MSRVKQGPKKGLPVAPQNGDLSLQFLKTLPLVDMQSTGRFEVITKWIIIP